MLGITMQNIHVCTGNLNKLLCLMQNQFFHSVLLVEANSGKL